MTYNPAAYLAEPGQQDFTVPFPYINQNHVVVMVNGDITPVFEWPSSTKVRLWSPLTGGESVVIERRTPIDVALVKFQSGAILTQEDLNLAVRQLIFKQQELDALYEGRLKAALQRLSDNLGITTDPDKVTQQLAELVLEEQLLDDFRQRIADINLNAQGLIQQATTIQSISDVVDALGDFDGGAFATLIQSEADSRIAADQALAAKIDLIGATGPGGTSFILDLDTVLVNSSESLGSRLSSLQSSVNENTASILTEQSARVSSVEAVANSVALLQTAVDENTADILNEQSVRSSETSALASQISGLDAQVSSNSASIISEQTARVSGDNALSQSITSVQSQVNDAVSSVNTLSSAVNGLSARYGVSLNVNGHITGFIQNNDGETGDFTIVADRFAIVAPNGGSPLVPFEVSGGVTRIREAAIGTLTVNRLTSGALGAQITQNGDWIVGTGRIIWDNGVYMKVAGVGFGTQGQFIEWFGPRRAINQCNEATAIQYLKTNGDAYFGGSLTAGTIRNSGRSTDTAANAALELGPFGSEGNNRTVIATFGFSHSGTHTTSASGSGSTTASVRLERSTNNGSSWSTLTNFSATINGSWQPSFGPGEPGQVNVSGGATITFTDTFNTTGNLMYRLRLLSRPLPNYPTPNTPMVQTLTVISTEE